MSIPHRCSNHACHKRVTFAKHWEDYKRPRKCAGCGGTQFKVSWHRIADGKKDRCNCSGYHYPHRAGSAYCDSNPQAAFNIARDRFKLNGEVLKDLAAECNFDGGKIVKGDAVPF